ncbi:hypothetical protein [uncultured Lacinutrix sp.]|uniref:hypothetical protein n=1 Tax=uncultured Lacinutrix sp. TaxID=574032 RepID=UPI002619617E|nr:hypothetical protein [uncultured Lacinutrix sp.]
MKKLLLCVLLALSFTSCEKEELNETQPQQELEKAKVIGEWEMYRDENLESMIDQWTGTEWTTVDVWFQNTREDSQIILEFKADGTFVDRYADVEVANGVWEKLNDGRYAVNYIQDDNVNDALTQTRYITIYCDNTYSIEIEGNDRAVYYYRIIDTIECSDLINYNVE